MTTRAAADRRNYIAVEAEFFDHPKTVELGEVLAFRHLAAIAYCHRHRTDGRITRAAALTLGITAAQTRKLVALGVWEAGRSGTFRIHDYLKHQPSRDYLARLSDAGRKAVQTRWEREKHRTEVPPVSDPNTNRIESQSKSKRDRTVPVVTKARAPRTDRSRDLRGGPKSIAAILDASPIVAAARDALAAEAEAMSAPPHERMN